MYNQNIARMAARIESLKKENLELRSELARYKRVDVGLIRRAFRWMSKMWIFMW